MKILVVDDEHENLFIMDKMLSGFGEVHLEESGKGAVGSFVQALHEGEPYALIFMDIMMPDMDGHTTLKIMREVERKWQVPPGREAKVIVATALSDPKEANKAFFQGYATDFIVKPVNFKELSAKIKAIQESGCRLPE